MKSQNPFLEKPCEWSKTCEAEVIGRVRVSLNGREKVGFFCSQHMDDLEAYLAKTYTLSGHQSWKSVLPMDQLFEIGNKN